MIFNLYKRNIIKILSTLIIFIIILGSCMPVKIYAASNLQTVYVKGMYANNIRETSVIREINQNRFDQGYSHLTVDSMLRALAFIRARELSIYYSDKVRPSGTTSKNAGTSLNPIYYREYISKGNIQVSKESNPNLYEDYMKSSTKSIGYGNFYVNGDLYEVILLANNSIKEYTGFVRSTVTETVKINVKPEYLDLTININNPLNMVKGEKKQIEVKVGNTPIEKESFRWSTSKLNVVSIDNKETITAIGPGTTNIIMWLGTTRLLTIQANVTAPLENISLNKENLNMNVGDTEKLLVKYNPEDTTDVKDVFWESNNPDIVEVDNNGMVKAKSSGNAIVTAKVEKNLSASCNISVNKELEKIEFEEDEITMNRGDSKTLSVKLIPEDIVLKDKFIWSSSDESVVSVSENGKITAMNAGNAIITASVDGKSTKCTVNVKIPLEEIKLDITKLELALDETYNLKLFYLPEDNTDTPNVTWTSSDEKVAIVSNEGTVKAVGEGTSIVTAKTTDGTNKTVSCEVVVKTPFNDIRTTDWFYDPVKYTYEKGIIIGTSDATFNPNTKLTRGMLVTILHRMDGKPTPTTQNKFSDVYKSQYYYDAVIWATEKEIVHGYGDGSKFGPDSNITRQDLAVMLRNYAQYKGKNVNLTANLNKFKDGNLVSDYAKSAMQWAVGKGVITGNNNGESLTPHANSTRAETAGMIYNYCIKVK